MSEESVPCPGCAEGWAPISAEYCNACYAGQVYRLKEALRTAYHYCHRTGMPKEAVDQIEAALNGVVGSPKA